MQGKWEEKRTLNRPHLAVGARNQPQRNEALRLTRLSCFIHKHVREVSDSRAKDVLSGHFCQGVLASDT